MINWQKSKCDKFFNLNNIYLCLILAKFFSEEKKVLPACIKFRYISYTLYIKE